MLGQVQIIIIYVAEPIIFVYQEHSYSYDPLSCRVI